TALPVSCCRIVQQATMVSGFDKFQSCPASKARRPSSSPTGKGSANAWEAEADGQRYFVAVGQMSNIDWPWQLVVTVPKTRQLEPASESTMILIGVLGLATLLACAIGYAMSRAIGGPVTKLLENAQHARSGNIELMEDVKTGSRE